MPSVLTEGLFMMLPDQEAALRSAEGQRLYAQAVADGLRAYLEDRAREPLKRMWSVAASTASPVANPAPPPPASAGARWSPSGWHA